MTRSLLAKVIVAALVCASAAAAQAAVVPIPPSPTRWATDDAAFLSADALQATDRALEDFERTTGNQVLVWIGRTTGDDPLEDWTVRAFAAWKVGRQGLDNGLVLFVFADDRAVRIEVGYGLEDRVPDAVASRIINELVIPRIRAGDRDGAVRAGVDELIARISGRAGALAEASGARSGAAPPAASTPRERAITLANKLIAGVIGLLFLVLLITNPRLALYLLFTILSSGGRSGGGGGGGFGGGGFSGGGGGSGGGGASGRW